jgi:MFS transporter, FHS family, glucose/mannose:H+ symporter
LRGLDLNQGPLGYEPNELPDCSTPPLYSNNAETQGQTTQRRFPPLVAYSGEAPMPPRNPTAVKGLSSRMTELLLHLGFASTGVGTVLLGSILPRLAMQWHLRDKDAGLLLLVQFAGSASGALMVRTNLAKTMACGYALFATGGLSIFLLQQHSLLAFPVFGIGMGMAMTSTNVLVGRRSSNRRGAALAILNFAWSAGAVVCPLLAAQLLRHLQAGSLFALLGLSVLPFALLPAFAATDTFATSPETAIDISGSREVWTIIYFAVLAFLYVGVESAVGNWMSTYATRDTALSFAGSSLAISLFWAALLLGRAMTPAGLRVLSEQTMYRLAIVIAIAGICVLLAARHRAELLAGSAITGFALGPVFPLNLSLYLTEIGKSRNVGWAFAVAGLGGAVCSWLTGVVSSATGSLRIALAVPGIAAVIMAAMATLRRRRETLAP